MKLRSYITIFYLLILAISITFITSCAEKKSVKEESATTEESGPGKSVAAQDLAKAPMFQGKNLIDDKDISMDDLKEHVLIINFWATWCPPCREEIPGFVELYDKYKDKKFAVLGMSVDRAGEGVVKEFMEEYKMNYPVIMVTRQMQSDYEKAIGKPIRAIPTSLIVNREGEIVSVHVGFRTKSIFEQEIQKLL